MTYHPTTRVLAVLELLQTYHQLSAAELARRLEVDVRTVRRYIVMLQEIGIPVAAIRGRAGGYRLRPGYKLPPLIFSEGEALAALLGLLLVAQQTRTGDNADAMGAVAKIARVLPANVRQRWAAVQQTLVMHDPQITSHPPPAEMLATLAVAIQEERPLWLRYRSNQCEETTRLVEPYGIVHLLGSWYLAGYCHLRADLRMFRIERIQAAESRPGPYRRPPDFDPLAFVQSTLLTRPSRWSIEVLLQTSLASARQAIWPMLGVLEPTPEGVLFRYSVDNLRWVAHRLLSMEFTWEIRQPLELIAEVETVMREIQARIGHSAALVGADNRLHAAAHAGLKTPRSPS